MDRHERWFLEIAVALRPQLRALTGPHIAEAFNRPHHGLDAQGVADSLLSLLRQGFIALSQRDGEPVVDHEGALRGLLAADGEAGPSAGVFYGATPSGGEAWERVAHPDWDRYIEASFATDPARAEIICADPARLEEYAFSSEQRSRPIASTVRRDQVAPWPATYWKVLPVGHRLRYAYDERPMGSDHSSLLESQAWLREMSTWFSA